MNSRQELEQAAQSAGVTLRMGVDDGDEYAVVLWRSHGPLITGCHHNRVLICRSHDEAMVAVEVAWEDLKRAKAESGYFNA